MKLSVIIPVYRVEATLDRCVESVLNQNIANMEVILVDDGSDDACPVLCNQWQERDNRVCVIHKRNGGLSDARNAGIKKATGDYLAFVDSDDYLEPNTYLQLLPLVEDCDILEFPVEKSVNGEKIDILSLQDRTYDNMQDYWIGEEVFEHCYAWNKLYRRELFENVKFPVGRVFEDIYTLRRLLLNARCVRTTSKGLYHYCMNAKGITATAKGPELEMLLDAHLAALRHWYTPAYYMRILNTQMDVYEQTGKEPMLRFRYISPFDRSLTPMQKIKALMQDILGIKGICILNKAIHRNIYRHL